MITTYKPGTSEFKNLSAAAALMTMVSPNGYYYKVRDVYFDLGQGWMWTTILTDDGEWGGFQALNPREHEAIIMAVTAEDIARAVTEHFNDKYCADHRKGE